MTDRSAAARVLVLGAHPDDAEILAGGLLVRHCRRGTRVRIVSVTDGRSGHQAIPPEELARVRSLEADAAGRSIGAEYAVWDFHDGSLQPTLDVRWAILREIRNFAPDVVLTHRPNDYHPDHRAVGMAVQDASYLVTVPHICPDTPALRSDPVVAYMCDLFTRPNPLRPDIVLDIAAEFDAVARMAACHGSQVFQWLPFHDGLLEDVPQSPEARLVWLCGWLRKFHSARREHFQTELVARGLELDAQSLLEVYEVSEYAGQADVARLAELFPGAIFA